MAQLSEYLDNPYYRKMYAYGLGSPNGGHYKWFAPPDASFSGMPIANNEYITVSMKHGSNSADTYNGSIKNFSPLVTPEVHRQVAECSRATRNEVGCSLSAAKRILEKGNNPPVNPFGVSYLTGGSPYVPRAVPSTRPFTF